ncbi:MAG: Late embryosis abundant protein [Bryobacterales bacterium]|jgi:gas vesicle protein|nr:Late embryosis abundant protein [Bryobacterales bacterium]
MNRDGFANFIFGLGVGLGAGLLLAPRSGDETRQLLKEKADEGTEYLKKQTADLRDNATDLLDKGRQALDRQRDQVADAMAAGRQAYREKVEEMPQQPA